MTRTTIARGLLATLCCAFLLQGLAACETTEGLGRDMQKFGKNIEDEAQE